MSGPGTSSDDRQGLEARRLFAALRRSAWIVVAVAALITAVVVAFSLLTPDKFESTATIIRQEIATALGGTDAETSRRELETIERLLTTNRVLNHAAREIPGESASALRSSVQSSIDETANLIEVTATAGDPERAAQRANRVATGLLFERSRLERRRLQTARESLESEAARLRAAAQGDPQSQSQLEALQQQLSQLTVQEASAGSDLQLAQAAEPPEERTSPKPLRNAVLALFAGLFFGVILALAREQLVPRLRDAREVGRVTDMPVLVEVPHVGGSRRRRPLLFAAENEAYQALRTAVELAMPADRQRTILVTSALHGEGKTTVTARLGTALAQAGHKTMLVSADLRRPELHARFGLQRGRGFGEVLAELQTGDAAGAEDLLHDSLQEVRLPARRRMLAPLDVLLSGEGGSDASTLLSMESIRAFLRVCRRLDHRYVLLDAPPLLGLSDTQVMAQAADALLVVARLDRLTVDRTVDLREALRRVESDPLGLVVIGGRTETSPYYLPDTQLTREERALR
jgi:Mrp family chromosome partitioning ATPase